MHITIDLEQFQVPIGVEAALFSLADQPTRTERLYKSRSDYESLLEEYREELQELQSVLYAHHQLCGALHLSAWVDAAGKDRAIKHVMSGVNPLGCQAFNFKRPTEEELDHDFMWRTSKRLPGRGRIGVFNRSCYEEVVAVRVHAHLLQNQRLPDECRERPHIWEERYRDMVGFEDYLARNGTQVIKFFLHVSREEQRRRLLSRIDRPDKNWKMTPADLESRRYWDVFQHAYEQCLRHTSHQSGLWHAVPADDKYNERLIISQIILYHMAKLRMRYPELTEEHRR
jgi:PPK2 family polyphosphate:nucleotide phosphotransferase